MVYWGLNKKYIKYFLLQYLAKYSFVLILYYVFSLPTPSIKEQAHKYITNVKFQGVQRIFKITDCNFYLIIEVLSTKVKYMGNTKKYALYLTSAEFLLCTM